MMHETDRFEVVGESGQHYFIVESRDMLTTNPLSGNPRRRYGPADYRLSDGRHVNWIDDKTFQILDTKEIIRKV